MNRKRKVGLAALLLGLALILTGCYIAPDDVNTGGYTGSTGALPFQTLAPTATVAVTPDTVVIETPDSSQPTIQVVNQEGPTSTPTQTPGTGWNDWGTVSGTTGAPGESTPLPSSGVFGTAAPAGQTGGATETETGTTDKPTEKPTIRVVTAAPATPSPTPKSLQRGFNGEEVRKLQRRLKELGYYTGSVDGDFGKATEEAVKAFQKANGLTADGKVGDKTEQKLYSSKAITKREASATATPKVTAKPTKKVTATPRPTATPNLQKDYYLQTGSSGDKVKTLQKRLIELGYLTGTATGKYDESTKTAVMAFQKKTKGLYDDGVAGPETLKALYSSSAAKASSVAASTGKTLERGDTGDDVRSLQKRLKQLGYLSGSVDGSYGLATEAAVLAFQQANGLTPDGKAGTATLNKLYAENAQPSGGGSANTSNNGSAGSNNSGSSGSNSGSNSGTKPATGGKDTSGISSTGYVTLEADSQGEAVKKLQQRLKDLGYYTGKVDGKYGEGTEAAVMAFQIRNSLTVDGKAGPATQRALYGGNTAISYSAIREGEEGTAVKNLQYTLYELGYYDGKVDGVYGVTTKDAVRAFQIQNKLTPVDGVAGSATLSRLYSADAIPATAAAVSYDTVRPGEQGEIVVEIQDCLVQMGYLETITGVYDDATEAAIKAFQRANGISADGVAGGKTLALLFGY